MKLKFLTVLAVSVLTQEISRNERSFRVPVYEPVSFGDIRISKAPCFPCSSERISEPIFQNQQLENVYLLDP